VPLHIHAHPAKRHALHAQSEFLFSGIFSGQLNGAAGADHPVPGQSRNLSQNPHHLTRGPRPARSLRYSSVARHRSRRQGPNAAYDPDPPILGHTSVRLAFRGLGFRGPAYRRLRLRLPIHGSRFTRQYLPGHYVNLGSPIQNFTHTRKTWDYDICIPCSYSPKLPFGE